MRLSSQAEFLRIWSKIKNNASHRNRPPEMLGCLPIEDSAVSGNLTVLQKVAISFPLILRKEEENVRLRP